MNSKSTNELHEPIKAERVRAVAQLLGATAKPGRKGEERCELAGYGV